MTIDVCPEIAHQIRDAVRAIAGKVVGRSDRPAVGALPDYWPAFEEHGLSLVGVPEIAGGSGGSLAELVVVVDELARCAGSTPLIESNTAAFLLSLLETVAPAIRSVTIMPAVNRSDVRIRGMLAWGRRVEQAVLVAPDELLVVDVAAVRLDVAENIAGEPRDLFEVQLEDARRYALPLPIQSIEARIHLLWSAAIVGAATGAYELTRQYVAQRQQFGAPLITIPSIAASLARMRTAIVQAEAAVQRATEALMDIRSDPDEQLAAAQVARVITGQTATDVAAGCHQLHGAIGITAEYHLSDFTRLLWAWRDTVSSQRHLTAQLGRSVRVGGERRLWHVLTRPRPAEEAHA
ncbi:acyl-CoA dehydrogenase family protein [Dactylosporangium sp. NPDC005572]|uniref:acyl-CoA dehydrogenase family protein n=1 Tax=Dactylosporangium sp. NPDC005572 TaxID=3156889 RepID=UPI0033B6024F